MDYDEFKKVTFEKLEHVLSNMHGKITAFDIDFEQSKDISIPSIAVVLTEDEDRRIDVPNLPGAAPQIEQAAANMVLTMNLTLGPPVDAAAYITQAHAEHDQEDDRIFVLFTEHNRSELYASRVTRTTENFFSHGPFERSHECVEECVPSFLLDFFHARYPCAQKHTGVAIEDMPDLNNVLDEEPPLG